VLKWCISRINHAQIKKPHLIVSYEMNKRIWGVYRPSKNEMVIYVNKHRTIRELTNTVDRQHKVDISVTKQSYT
jgi:hypothetical protein